MQNDRLILLSTLILGFFMFGAALSQASDDGANFKPFSEPEASGVVANNEHAAKSDYGKKQAGVGTKVEKTLKEKEKLTDIQAIEGGNGTISLIGSVKDEKQKQRAEEVASKIEGVNEVDNRLMVQN